MVLGKVSPISYIAIEEIKEYNAIFAKQSMTLFKEKYGTSLPQGEGRVFTPAFESNVSGDVVPILKKSTALDIVIQPQIAE